MKPHRLLSELVALSFDARFQRLYELARESRREAKIAAVFDAWEKGDWQERLFCAQSCAGSGDSARLLRLLDDPSRTVAGLALSLISDCGSDDMLVEVLAKAPKRRRRRLLSRLRSRRRLAVIDRFVDASFARSELLCGEFLPFASRAAVDRHLVKVTENGGALFWERFARHHPQLAVETILQRLSTTDSPDGALLRDARTVVSFAGRLAPDATIRLVRALAAFTPLSTMHLRHLPGLRPNETAQIVLDADETVPCSLAAVAPKIGLPLLLEVLRKCPGALPFYPRWFRRLPPTERGEVFEAIGRSWRDAEGFVAAELLALLPAGQRLDEAQRIAALPPMGTRPLQQAAYAPFLSWSDMQSIADRFLTHPEGELRAAGWGALLASLRFHREHASEILAMIRHRKFEQDPVRLVILQGLAQLPQGTWKLEHLDSIAGLTREALDATDLSYASAAYLTGFLQKLIASHPEWAAKQLALVYSERGNIGGFSLESRINDEQALVLEDAFVGVGGNWGKANRVGWLIWFAAALGKRLRVCRRLLKTLEDLLGSAGYFDDSIVQLLRQHLPVAEFEDLTKRLIRSHESWVAVGPIFAFLHRRRQDWLEPFLSWQKFRFKGGSTVELVNLLPTSGYQRYTLAQQQRLGTTLNDVIRLPAGDAIPKDVWTMLRALSFLAKLPAIEPARLVELSSDPRPVIAEAAIRILGRLDAGQGLPTLLTALGDNRARIAIYALRPALTELPSPQVVDCLRAAPMNKVTVAKEAIRLVGDFGGPGSFDWLAALAREKLHRDVRIAVLRALWEHLERLEAWEILREAADDPDGQILNGVVRIPADRLSEASRQHLIDLLTRLSTHADPIIRVAVFRRCAEMPFPDPDSQLLLRALRALSATSPDERSAVANLIAVNARAAAGELVAQAVAAIREQRRALHDFLQTLGTYCLANSPGRRRLAPVAHKIIESLRHDPMTAGLRINLAAAALGVAGWDEELQDFAAKGLLCQVVVGEAGKAMALLVQRSDRAEFANLERRLAASDNASLRFLAFMALVSQASDSIRWDESRRARLTNYRRDPSPEVAIPAQFYFEADLP